MSNYTEIINKFIEDIKEEIKEEVKEEVKKNAEEEWADKPKEGQRYWWLTIHNYITGTKWYDTDFDNNVYRSGNCYLTKADAEHKQALNECETKVRRFNKGWKPDWNDRQQPKFYLIWLADTENFITAVRMKNNVGAICYFETEELAIQFKDENEELFKRVYRIGEGRDTH
jgi:hypothetical protein